MGPGPTFAVEKEIPVISPVLTVRAVQIGAPPWQSMRPVEKQEVRQVCSDRHETCTLIFQLFEIYNSAHYRLHKTGFRSMFNISDSGRRNTVNLGAFGHICTLTLQWYKIRFYDPYQTNQLNLRYI